jgi:hypothetical protein
MIIQSSPVDFLMVHLTAAGFAIRALRRFLDWCFFFSSDTVLSKKGSRRSVSSINLYGLITTACGD